MLLTATVVFAPRLTRRQTGFWGEIANTFHWETPFTPAALHTSNFHLSKGPVELAWFAGGTTNMCFNALDRHVLAGHGDRVAFFWCAVRMAARG